MVKIYDVLTVFDACVDMVVKLGNVVPEFAQKEKLVDSVSIEMGGSNCIFASQCAKLGLKTTGIGVIGKDSFGMIVKDSLSANGVDTSFLKVDENINTAIGISLDRGHDRAILTYDESIRAVNPEMVTDEILGRARHLHIGSYYLLAGIKNELIDIMKRARRYSATISLDTNWDPREEWELPVELLELVDIFFPNENEIKLLSGNNDIDAAASYFLQYVPVVALKLGSDGAKVYSGETVISAKPLNVEVRDTIGAGDSFDAGFLYGFLNNLPLELCLKCGLFCGSMNVTQAGGCKGQADVKMLREYLAL